MGVRLCFQAWDPVFTPLSPLQETSLTRILTHLEGWGVWAHGVSGLNARHYPQGLSVLTAESQGVVVMRPLQGAVAIATMSPYCGQVLFFTLLHPPCPNPGPPPRVQPVGNGDCLRPRPLLKLASRNRAGIWRDGKAPRFGEERSN